MKKWLIGTLVGGLLIFIWQFLSWTVLDIHRSEEKYTASQDTILTQLSQHLKEEGVYMLPNVPPGSSNKDREEMGKKADGKPWATIVYRTAYDNNMTRPLIRGFLIDLFLVFSLIYVLTRGGTPGGLRIFAGAVAVGLITFLWGPYTMHNWFQTPLDSLYGHLIDSLAAWGLAGAWLAWWLGRK